MCVQAWEAHQADHRPAAGAVGGRAAESARQLLRWVQRPADAARARQDRLPALHCLRQAQAGEVQGEIHP